MTVALRAFTRPGEKKERAPVGRSAAGGLALLAGPGQAGSAAAAPTCGVNRYSMSAKLSSGKP